MSISKIKIDTTTHDIVIPIEQVEGLSAQLDGKANSSHAHTIDVVDGLQANLDSLGAAIDSKVAVTRTVNGKALSSDITLSASDVDAYTKAEIDGYELITIEDIDTICGNTIQSASEVTF